VLPDWARLLDARDQPRSVADAYELVGQMFAAMEYPCPLDPRDLYPTAAARAGYLIAAASAFSGLQIDGSWVRLRDQLRARENNATDVELLVAEPGTDPYDELASIWGLRRGIDLRMVTRSRTDGYC
jgi:hypothetical protein